MEHKDMVDDILAEDFDMEVTIPLKDLIWTIVDYSETMSKIDDELFDEALIPSGGDFMKKYKLIQEKEKIASKRYELTRLISQYSEFDTKQIWSEIAIMFNNYII